MHQLPVSMLNTQCFIFIILDEHRLRWIARFTSGENKHVLPLFTSLLNIVCAYDPVGMGLPYNYLLFNDSREPLVEIALQVDPLFYCHELFILGTHCLLGQG